jgi:hypothetical protein
VVDTDAARHSQAAPTLLLGVTTWSWLNTGPNDRNETQMPALPPVPQVVKAEVLHVTGVIPVVNVLHFLATSGTIAPGDVQTFASRLVTAWATNLMPRQTSQVTLQAIRVTDLTSLTGEQVLQGGITAGSRTGSYMAASTAACITHRTATRSRSARGRTFIGGVSVSDTTTSQQLSTGALTAYLNAWAAFKTAANTAGSGASALQLVVVSYYSGTDVNGRPLLRTTPVVYPVTLETMDTRLDTQRRRLG